jgi:hypothetical protein
MKRGSFGKTAAIVAGLLFGGFVVLVACSNQGEGERCELLNNNEDCESPLICTAPATLPEGFNSAARCCPADRTQATTAACGLPTTGPLGDSAPPPDTGPPQPPTDGGTDVNVAPDAPTDAADGG